MTENEDIHIIEAVGRTRIVIKDGKVTEVGTSRIRHCPLAKKFAFPVSETTPENIRGNIEHRIKSWGMCTPERTVLDTKPFVGFGASEILSFGLSAGLLDAIVLATDGAGTIIATNPALVQGTGGRMSGLVKTVPYPDVIRQIEENGGFVIDKTHATLNQTAGVAKAYEMGFKKVAVTIALPEEAKKIREKYPDVLIFGVHVTGVNRQEAEIFASSADLMTSCASGTMRQVAGKKALLQAGVAVPIFAMTKKGKDIIIEKIRQSNDQVLFKGTVLPALSEQQPEPLI